MFYQRFDLRNGDGWLRYVWFNERVARCYRNVKRALLLGKRFAITKPHGVVTRPEDEPCNVLRAETYVTSLCAIHWIRDAYGARPDAIEEPR